jgi:glycosyltransferase involved in cell wall biosynthesis
MSYRQGQEYSVAFVVPTRNRPDKLEQCLTSLTKQTECGFSVVIVASGNDVGRLVSEFQQDLDIQYVYSEESGQIYQRNIGIKLLLDKKTDYIGFLDDDMILDVGAICAIRKFICTMRRRNECNFGVSLNIVNSPNYRDRPFFGVRKLLLRVGDRPGSVTRSGMNTSIENVQQDIRSDWLGGGYTVWSGAVLRRYPQTSTKTRHAAGEDLIYSYRVGKEYHLYVCSEARIIHQDEPGTGAKITRYRTKKDAVAHCVFCDQHKELNITLYVVTGFIYHLLLLVVPNRNGFSHMVGFATGIYHFFRRRQTGIALLEN